jgi:hypothetical protein
MISLSIPGHCYPLKTHRPIRVVRSRQTGRLIPIVGKSSALRAYEKRATLLLKQQWAGRPPLEGRVPIRLHVMFAGPEPDALGPAETVFDLLQAAGVVGNDRQLVPCGCADHLAAVVRTRVPRKDEGVEITLGDSERRD